MTNSMSGPVHGQVVQAGAVHGDVNVFASAPAEYVPPSRLPALPPLFVNRVDPHRLMSEAADEAAGAGRAARIGLYGPAGVGVTTAAGQWAAVNGRRFPDGVVHIDFRDGQTVADALGEALTAVGVPVVEQAPTSGQRAAQLWRVVGSRRVLFLLDNVVGEAQVTAFTPTAPGSAVLVATHRRLSALHAAGFRQIPIRPLAHDYGARLLSVELTSAEALVVAKACAGYPLAIKLVDALLASAPEWRLPALLGEIEAMGVAVLDPEDRDVLNAHFELAYGELPDAVAATYRRLSAHPGPEFGAAAISALVGADAGGHLVALAKAQLVDEVGEGRYRLHELLLQHAQGKAEHVDGAVPRLLEWYLRRAVAAERAMSGRWRVSPLFGEVPAMASRHEASAFLHVERGNLVAAARLADDLGLDALTWQFCEALWGLFHKNGLYDDWITTHEAGLRAARREGDDNAVMHLASQLGSAHFALREFVAAEPLFAESLALATRTGHASGVQSALEWLGKILIGRPAALGFFERSRLATADVPERDRPRTYALLHLQNARAFIALERAVEALPELDAAAEHFDGTTESDNQAKVRLERGRALLALNRKADAVEVLQHAADVFGRDGSPRSRAVALVLLSDATGDESHRVEAAAIYARLGITPTS